MALWHKHVEIKLEIPAIISPADMDFRKLMMLACLTAQKMEHGIII